MTSLLAAATIFLALSCQKDDPAPPTWQELESGLTTPQSFLLAAASPLWARVEVGGAVADASAWLACGPTLAPVVASASGPPVPASTACSLRVHAPTELPLTADSVTILLGSQGSPAELARVVGIVRLPVENGPAALDELRMYFSDHDGDGYSSALELVVGSSPEDPNSVPEPNAARDAMLQTLKHLAPFVTWQPVPDLDVVSPSSRIILAAPEGGRYVFQLLSDDPGAVFLCSLDGSPPEPCSDTLPLASLPDGDHRLEVRAADEYGTLQALPSAVEWTQGSGGVQRFLSLDTILGPGLPPFVNATSLTFTFACQGIDCLFECSLDGSPFAACSTPFTVEAQAGAHVLEVRATQFGIPDDTPARHDWVVDTVAPLALIQSQPAALDASSTASFAFTCSEADCSATCSLDGDPFSTCTSPHVLSGLADGSHTLQVKAVDPAGNESAVAAYAWTVDTTAPAPPEAVYVIVGQQAPGLADKVYGLSGAVEGAAIVGIYEDALLMGKLAEAAADADGSFSTVEIGDNKGDAADRIYVTATDIAGNTSAPTSVANDKTPPTITLSSLTPSGSGGSSTPTVSGTTEAGAKVQILANGVFIDDGWAGSNGSFGITPSSPVPSNTSSAITAKAIDSAGNVSSVSNTLTYLHDNLLPSGGLVTDGGPNDVASQKGTWGMTAVWSGFTDANGIASYEYNLSVSPNCQGEKIASNDVGLVTSRATGGLTLANGVTYYNCVRARDTVGNSGAWVASNGILVDTTPPNAPTYLETVPSSPASNDKPTIKGWAEANATIQVFDDGNLIGTGSAPVNGSFSVGATTAVTANAMNTITAKATDAAGNVSGSSNGLVYVHDSIAPTFAGAGTASMVSSTQIDLTWTAATDALTPQGSIVYLICRNTTYGACASNFTTTYTTTAGATSYSATTLNSGTRYFFVIRARDQAGNVDTNVVEKSAYTWSTQAVQGFSAGGSAADDYSCALVGNGTVKCWGGNTYGQLGNGTTTASTTPVTVSGLSAVVAISAGPNNQEPHACALKADGYVWCWGRNAQGELGIGNNTGPETCSSVACSKLPLQVQGSLANVVAISVGSENTCALRSDGAAYCWGDNYYGQLGIGNTTDTYTPAAVSGGNTFTAISTTGSHACAITSGGGAKCWGWNNVGQLGEGSGSGPEVCNGQSCAMTAQTVLGVGGVGSLSNVVSISAGSRVACARLSDGGARCWGLSNNGQLGNGGTANSTTPVIVAGFGAGTGALGVTGSSAGGADHNCAVMSDGTERCWGSNTTGELGNGTNTGPDDCSGNACGKSSGAVQTLTSVAWASNGSQTSFALMADGTLQSWGYNTPNSPLGRVCGAPCASPGAVTVLEGPVGLIAPTRARASGSGAGATRAHEPISAGDGHACAVATDGQARCWGLNANGQLGIGSTTNSTTPVKITSIGNVVSVSSGGSHACALVAGGTVKCWGKNANGQLGDNSTTERTSPVAVCDAGSCATSLSKVAAIAAGGSHTCALIYDGTIKCWGLNTSGQLGDGTNNQSLTPVAVSGITTAVAVSTGDNHTCAVLADGTPRCWGYNASGQLGNGDNVNQNTPVTLSGNPAGVRSIAAGGDHACFVGAGGTAQCWGLNTDGQLGDGTNTTRNTPAAVAGSWNLWLTAGKNHTCALNVSGTATCWGDNANGQIGDGSTADWNIPKGVFGLASIVSLAGGGDFTCASLSDGAAKCWGGNTYGQVGDGTTAQRSMATAVINLP
ncbi:MAG: hypothetical protein HYY13_13650 [Nitrospirae bacterium]|nr:hypothetical protein [Nitrospirota bacterium]